MYVRVLKIKFPNELAKKSVIALSRNVTKDHFKNGLILRLHTDISSNSSMIILLWKTRELFEATKKNGGTGLLLK